MKAEEKDAIIKLYSTRMSKHGRSMETLGWKNRESQNLRFQVLCDIAELSGTSICDVGCGFGDLLDYLRGRYREFEYTGVDICADLLDEARRIHSGTKFIHADILESSFDERFDFYLLSGALNYRIERNFDFTALMIEKMFRLANKGVAVNFLTSYVDFENPLNFYHSPEDVFKFARKLTRRVSLRHDYKLWEFTVFLYKESKDS